MQEHPIPRQITTFEFKLIGEMTVKQFGYLAFGIACAAILYFLAPKVLFLNLILAIILAALGFGFAFVPINDRPMDIWLKNMFKRLFSPTQYFYRKNNHPPKILLGLQLPPREVLLQHVKAQQSLNEYLQKKPKTDARDNVAQIDANVSRKMQELSSLMAGSATIADSAVRSSVTTPKPMAYTPVAPLPSVEPAEAPSLSAEITETVVPANNPDSADTLSGTVMSTSGIPLANQMVYIKKGQETVRLFKTNQNGQFQNNLPLAPGDYLLEITDPQKKHDFARMKVNQQSSNLQITAIK